MISSRRPPRWSSATQTASYSSTDQPSPSPTDSRPWLARSIAVNVRASSNGEYHGATSTLVPSRMRSVAVAASVRATNGSSTEYCSAGSSPSIDAG